MFAGNTGFNQPLSDWDVSSVTTMAWMFGPGVKYSSSSWTNPSYKSKFNQDLNIWDMVAVTTIESMFFEADSFNHDLSSWRVASLTTSMKSFCLRADLFNLDLGAWGPFLQSRGVDAADAFSPSACWIRTQR